MFRVFSLVICVYVSGVFESIFILSFGSALIVQLSLTSAFSNFINGSIVLTPEINICGGFTTFFVDHDPVSCLFEFSFSSGVTRLVEFNQQLVVLSCLVFGSSVYLLLVFCTAYW